MYNWSLQRKMNEAQNTIEKIMSKNVPNAMKNINLEVKESPHKGEETLSTRNMNEAIPKYIIIKLLKTSEKNFKRENSKSR